MLFMKSPIKLLFPLLFVLFSFSAQAQYQLAVALSMNDCTSCYGNISNIKKLNERIKVTFILKENLKTDSADIVSNFGISKKNFSLKFSDKLYDQLIGIGGQTMVYAVKDGFILGGYFLKTGINAAFVENFNGLIEDSTQLKFSKDFYDFAARELIFRGTKIAVEKPLEGKVVLLDRLNTDLNTEIVIADSLLLQAYEVYHKDKKLAQEELAFFKNRYGKSLYNLYDVEITKGKVYINAGLRTLTVSDDKRDTVEGTFSFLFLYDYFGNFLDYTMIKKFWDSRGNPSLKKHEQNNFLDTSMYYPSASSFILLDSSLIFNCKKIDFKDRLENDYLFAKYDLNKKGEFEFNGYLPFQHPKVVKDYQYNFNNNFTSPDNRYFTIAIEGKMYDFQNSNAVPKDFLKFNNVYKGDLFNFNQLVFDFTVKDSISYWIYLDRPTNSEYFVTANIHTQEIIKKVKLKSSPDKNFSYIHKIDPLDPNFVLTVTSRNTIERFKP